MWVRDAQPGIGNCRRIEKMMATRLHKAPRNAQHAINVLVRMRGREEVYESATRETTRKKA
jgi:hypothetical protein